MTDPEPPFFFKKGSEGSTFEFSVAGMVLHQDKKDLHSFVFVVKNIKR